MEGWFGIQFAIQHTTDDQDMIRDVLESASATGFTEVSRRGRSNTSA